MCSGARVMVLWDQCYSAASWQCHSSTVMSLGWCWWYHGSTILNIDVDFQKGYLVFSREKKMQQFLLEPSGFRDVKGFQFSPRRELSAAVSSRASAGLWSHTLLGVKGDTSTWGQGAVLELGPRQACSAAFQSLAAPGQAGNTPCVLCCQSQASFRTFVLGMSELHNVNRTAASRESSPGVGKSLLRAHH